MDAPIEIRAFSRYRIWESMDDARFSAIAPRNVWKMRNELKSTSNHIAPHYRLIGAQLCVWEQQADSSAFGQDPLDPFHASRPISGDEGDHLCMHTLGPAKWPPIRCCRVSAGQSWRAIIEVGFFSAFLHALVKSLWVIIFLCCQVRKWSFTVDRVFMGPYGEHVE
jgi:hypothetical protein